MANSHYKTHEELGITFAEYGALFAVRAMLQAGILEHTLRDDCDLKGKHLFNMNHSGKIAHCGSVGCIGGNMAIIMQASRPGNYVYKKSPGSPLYGLFYPTPYDFDTITPKEAAKAISNFLHTGNPHWDNILKTR